MPGRKVVYRSLKPPHDIERFPSLYRAVVAILMTVSFVAGLLCGVFLPGTGTGTGTGTSESTRATNSQPLFRGAAQWRGFDL
jgi:hypothetical protein